MRKIYLFMFIFLFTAFSLSAFRIPKYSKSELKNRDFVLKELKKLKTVKNEVVLREKRASEIERLALQTDLKNIDAVMELLNYVKKNGYNEGDANLFKLKYFSLVPHVIKPVREEKKSGDKKGKKIKITPPKLLTNPPIDFSGSKFKNVSGNVKVLLLIDEKGKVEEAYVHSAPNEEMGKFVKNYILKKWKFKPAMKNGKPTRVKYRYVINLSKNK